MNKTSVFSLESPSPAFFALAPFVQYANKSHAIRL
jgi:hypothetical protein